MMPMKMKADLKSLPFKTWSDAEQKRLLAMLQGVWQYIGADAIQACGGDLSRSEVIELTLDADRLEMEYGKKPEDAELIKRYRSLSYRGQCNIARLAFPFNYYGM